MRKFFEAFVYFVENGIDPKSAKEFADKVTGIKAPEGKIERPKTKSPDQFQTPKAKDDVIEASDNVSGNYAQGDTKYNADILAEELARKRGFIKEGYDADLTIVDMSKKVTIKNEMMASKCGWTPFHNHKICLLYTSDAADDA